MNWYWSAKYDNISISLRLPGIGGGGNNLHLVPHSGEIIPEMGDMDIYPAWVSVIIRGNQSYFHGFLIVSSAAFYLCYSQRAWPSL